MPDKPSRTKRADRRSGGLLPELELDRDRDDKRYSVRPPVRHWTPVEDAFLTAGVLACQSASAYALTCPALLKLMDRAPTYTTTAKPSVEKVQDDCIRAVELRLISKMIGGVDGPWQPHDFLKFGCRFRAGMPLTWGERVKFWKTWRQRGDKPARLGFDQMIVVSSRHRQDRAKIIAYLESVSKYGKGLREYETPSARPAVRPDNQNLLGAFFNSMKQQYENGPWNGLIEDLAEVYDTMEVQYA